MNFVGNRHREGCTASRAWLKPYSLEHPHGVWYFESKERLGHGERQVQSCFIKMLTDIWSSVFPEVTLRSGIWVRISEVMRSVVMWSELTWYMWSDFVLKWSELKWSELHWSSWGQSTMHIWVTLYWGYLIVLWLFHWCVSCTVAVLICFVIRVCGCVYVLVCGLCNVWVCVYVWVFW